jgi:polysaccharide deacetylase 2 family uncharacterized protein YibQ
MKKTLLYCLMLSLLPLYWEAAEASPPFGHRHANIVIIIDDIGDNLSYGLRAVRLPGAVSCAFLPHTNYAHQLAIAAHKLNKEVMLHLPMESEDERSPGPGALTLAMAQEEFISTFQDDLAAIPYATGVNNHMGSLITQNPEHMSWLMQEINRQGKLFFVDSRTTEATVAQRVAQESGVPNLRRNVFLDNDQRPEAIARQFSHLLALAKRHGSAVAIGHPHPTTLRFLEEQLPHLSEQGIQLVSASQLIALKQHPETIYAAKALEISPTAAIVTP